MEAVKIIAQWSPERTKIAAALVAVQAAMDPAPKDKNNPHFSSTYADLAGVTLACRKLLTANGIAVIQTPYCDGMTVTVETELLHSSGEYVRGWLTMTASKDTPQAIGSCITYARRYAVASMVGVVVEDDDGNAASAPRGDNRKPSQSNQQREERQRQRPQQQQPRAGQQQQRPAMTEADKQKMAASRANMVAQFKALNIAEDVLADFASKPLEEFQPADFVKCGGLLAQLKDGSMTLKQLNAMLYPDPADAEVPTPELGDAAEPDSTDALNQDFAAGG